MLVFSCLKSPASWLFVRIPHPIEVLGCFGKLQMTRQTWEPCHHAMYLGDTRPRIHSEQIVLKKRCSSRRLLPLLHEPKQRHITPKTLDFTAHCHCAQPCHFSLLLYVSCWQERLSVNDSQGYASACIESRHAWQSRTDMLSPTFSPETLVL